MQSTKSNLPGYKLITFRMPNIPLQEHFEQCNLIPLNVLTMPFNQSGITNSRRKILYWAAGAFSGILLWRFNKKAPDKAAPPVKMLTEDGQLVEVDARFLGTAGR